MTTTKFSNPATTNNGTTSSSPDSLPYFPIWFQISASMITILITFGNGIIIYFIVTRRRLRKKTNFLVCSLAVSDLLVGMILTPSSLVCMHFECSYRLSKHFYDAFVSVSVCNLCCITFDRYLAVTRPLKYHTGIIQLPIKTMITISWIVPSTVSFMPVIWSYSNTNIENQSVNNKIFYTAQVLLFMICPCLLMLIAYVVMFTIVREKIQQIRGELQSAVITVCNISHANSTSTSSTREAKATLKVFGTVVVLFVACCGLSAFRTIVIQYKLMEVSNTVTNLSRLILVANSAMNPVIYAFWKNDINKEISKFFRCNSPVPMPSPATLTSGHEARTNQGPQVNAVSFLKENKRKTASNETKC